MELENQLEHHENDKLSENYWTDEWKDHLPDIYE